MTSRNMLGQHGQERLQITRNGEVRWWATSCGGGTQPRYKLQICTSLIYHINKNYLELNNLAYSTGYHHIKKKLEISMIEIEEIAFHAYWFLMTLFISTHTINKCTLDLLMTCLMKNESLDPINLKWEITYQLMSFGLVFILCCFNLHFYLIFLLWFCFFLTQSKCDNDIEKIFFKQ